VWWWVVCGRPYQADTAVNNQRQADFGSIEGLRAWRDMLIKNVRPTEARGGCPLGSLVGQLAESDPEARALIAAGFEEWSSAISDGLRALSAAGQLRSDIDPDDLALTLLATLHGGLLLSQIQRSTRPWNALSTLSSALPLGVEHQAEPTHS
jgi:TetR/AcrR family transcriptional regulator, transcriptional repressor for nem operon